MCQCNSGISGMFDEYNQWATQPGDPNYVNPNWGYDPTYVNTGGGVKQMGFWDVLSTGIKSASGILGTRYSVPQLNPGALIQTGPNGQSLMYQGTAGNMSIPSLSNMGSGDLGSMLPLLAIGAVAFMMFKK